MRFNYLQTDDRDDYFSRFNKGTGKKLLTGVDLISPTGRIIFKNVPTYKVRSYCKSHYITNGESAKKIWRNILLEKGYQVINVYSNPL